MLKAHGPSEFPIAVRQLSDSGDFRPLLKQIKNSAEAHIVLDCSTEKVYEVLKQAQQIGMMSDYHSYLITSLDLHVVDLDEFKYGGTNITAFRIVNPDKDLVQNTIQEWETNEARQNRKVQFGPSTVREHSFSMNIFIKVCKLSGIERGDSKVIEQIRQINGLMMEHKLLI